MPRSPHKTYSTVFHHTGASARPAGIRGARARVAAAALTLVVCPLLVGSVAAQASTQVIDAHGRWGIHDNGWVVTIENGTHATLYGSTKSEGARSGLTPIEPGDASGVVGTVAGGGPARMVLIYNDEQTVRTGWSRKIEISRSGGAPDVRCGRSRGEGSSETFYLEQCELISATLDEPIALRFTD